MTRHANMSAVDLVVRPEPVPLLPMEPQQAAMMMERYQALCESILTPDDSIGIPGQPGGFIKRSGYSKLATFYGSSSEILSLHIRRGDDGEIISASAMVRARHPNGRQEDGDGACSITEPRFKNPSGRQKAEHDIPATAVTRARNRAISNLIGFGSVSAEEVEEETPAGPRWGEVATDQQQDGMIRALQDLGATGETARKVITRAGYVPKIVALALMWTALEAKEDEREAEVVEAVKEAFDATEEGDTEADKNEAEIAPTSVQRTPEEILGRPYGTPPETEVATDGDDT